jgi:hypothetical protein
MYFLFLNSILLATGLGKNVGSLWNQLHSKKISTLLNSKISLEDFETNTDSSLGHTGRTFSSQPFLGTVSPKKGFIQKELYLWGLAQNLKEF